jgi:hypothetical protein
MILVPYQNFDAASPQLERQSASHCPTKNVGPNGRRCTTRSRFKHHGRNAQSATEQSINGGRIPGSVNNP